MLTEFITETIEQICLELILIESGDIQERILTVKFFT
jgi:hypothetical protein